MSALGKVMRNGPAARRMENFYANMARSGYEAGLSGTDILPMTRRGLGVGLGSATSGLADYEYARAFAQEAKKNMDPAITSLSHPEAQQSLRQYFPRSTDGLESPLSRNLLNGLNPDLQPNKVVSFLERHRGPASDRRLSSTIGGAVAAGAGYAMHGIPGALGAVAAAVPELAAAHLGDTGRVGFLTSAKSKMMNYGRDQAQAGRQFNPWHRRAINFFDRTAGETIQMGRDVGKPTGDAAQDRLRRSLWEAGPVHEHAQHPLRDAIVHDFPDLRTPFEKLKGMAGGQPTAV